MRAEADERRSEASDQRVESGGDVQAAVYAAKGRRKTLERD
jgi:hypothetical protein